MSSQTPSITEITMVLNKKQENKKIKDTINAEMLFLIFLLQVFHYQLQEQDY